MDLRVNNISFNGKKEILYGLTKAAKNAKQYEITRLAYVSSRLNLNRDNLLITNKSSAYAYLDMVIKDSEFIKTANELTKKDLSNITKILTDEQTEHGKCEPLKTFQTFIYEVINNSYYGKSRFDIKKAADNLLLKFKAKSYF